MATIEQIQNILQKAKKGQFVSINCQGDTTNFNANVVSLDPDKFGSINAEQWTEGWEPKSKTDTPLCFTASIDGSGVLLNNVYGDYMTSTDGNTWSNYTLGDVIPLNRDDKVYFSARSTNDRCSTDSITTRFQLSGEIYASGNIMSLLNKSYWEQQTLPSDAFCALFFRCPQLKSAPILPAKTTSSFCYQNMFNECTQLTAAPELPATIIYPYCYQGMFSNCSSLKTAPALPGTSLNGYCYQSMFEYCSSLENGPEIFATSLNYDYCCRYMFSHCQNLKNLKVHFSNWGNGATSWWVYEVDKNGTFTCPSDLPQEKSAHKIPSNFTIQTF